MQFTIYTFGNVPVLWNVLNALAASTTNGWVLSAVGMGGLIGLVYVLAMSMTGTYDLKKIGNLVLSWGMICSLAMIPSTVWITDLFTGATKKVDNVPLLITAPYSLISATEQALFTRIDGALSSVSGSYISVSQYGLISPIKILMSMRSPQLPSQLRPDLYQNLQQSMKDCAMGGSVNISTLLPAADALATLTANYRQTGLTTWRDQSGNVTDIGCADVGSKLTDAWNAAYATSASKSAATTIITKAVGGTDGKIYTFNDYSNIFGSIVGGAFNNANQSLGQTTAQATINSLAASTIAYTLNCMAELSSLNTASACQDAALINSDTAEQFKNDAVQNASFFTSIMYSSMAYLTFLFFAISPIVLVVCILWPMHAARLFMAYLMFGMWVSSWAIFYAPMGFFIQSEVQNVFTAYVNSGTAISMGNYAQVYADLSTKLGVAANTVASIPLISLAILSGSFFSLNSVAQRFSGEDHSDPSLMSSRLRTNAALVQGAPEFQQSVTSGLAQRSNSASKTIEMSISDSTSTQSARQFGIKEGIATRDGWTWSDSKGASHTVSTTEMEKYGQDYKHGTQIGMDGRGYAASRIVAGQYSDGLKELQNHTGLNEAKAAKLAGNVAYLNAQQNHKNSDVAGMLAGTVGNTDAERAQNKAIAALWVKKESDSLLLQKGQVGAIVAGSIAKQGIEAGVNGSLLSKADVSGLSKGVAKAASVTWDKAVGDIDAKASDVSGVQYMYGKGYTKQTVDDFKTAQTLTRNLSAEASHAIERGDSYSITSTQNAAAGYRESMDLQGIAALMRRQLNSDREGFNNAYQRVLDVENGNDNRRKIALKGQLQDNGLIWNDRDDEMVVKMTALSMMDKRIDLDSMRSKGVDNGQLERSVPSQIAGFNARGYVAGHGGSVRTSSGQPTEQQEREMTVMKGQAQVEAVGGIGDGFSGASSSNALGAPSRAGRQRPNVPGARAIGDSGAGLSGTTNSAKK